MREIKFRVWFKPEHKMYILTGMTFDASTGDVYCVHFPIVVFAPRNDIELMQYTGLKDRNGKEIYEGDIVATGIGPKHVKSIVRIGKAETYIDFPEHSIRIPYYGVYLEGSELEGFLFKGEMYILGNIYENGDLLREKM